MTTTTASLIVGGSVTVWTDVIVAGVTTKIETTIEILEVAEGHVLVAITPPPAAIEIVTREGPD